MKNMKVFTLILIITIFCLNINSSSGSIADFAEYNNEFSVKVFQQILKDKNNEDESIIFSPLSIQCIGALLLAGAEGETANEILKGFNLPGVDIASATNEFTNFFQGKNGLLASDQIKIGNKIFLSNSYTLRPTFLNVATINYESDVENINFNDVNQAAETISEWVETKTHGKLKDFVTSDAIDPATKMYLVNLLRFKGEWKDKFDPANTLEKTFFISRRKQTKLPMMFKSGHFESKIFSDIQATGVNLKFKDGDLSLFILTPIFDSIPISKIEQNLHKANLKEIFSQVEPTDSGSISMPKFKSGFSVDLKEVLKRLGLQKMFDFTKADFSNMIETDEPLSVSGAKHRAFVEFTEEGGEASAATDAAIESRMGMHIELNRPFLYFIKSTDGEIYFMGRFTGQ